MREHAPDQPDEASAQRRLDRLIDGELHRFWTAKLQLEVRVAELCRLTAGTAAGAEALRIGHALAGLFGAPVARPLLRARSSRRKAADEAASEITTAALQRAFHADPAGFPTVGD